MSLSEKIQTLSIRYSIIVIVLELIIFIDSYNYWCDNNYSLYNIIIFIINFYYHCNIGTTIKPSTTPTVTTPGKWVLQIKSCCYMFILGSCLALNLHYSGCCKTSLTKKCSHKGCYCDEYCHKWNDCCSDIASISCNATST